MAVDPALAALLSFGGGLAAAGGPSRMPRGLGGALGQATQGGLAGYMQAQQMAQAEQGQNLQTLETALKLRAMREGKDQNAQRQQALARWTQTLPEEQRALAMAYPELLAKQQAEAVFREPDRPETLTPYQQAQLELQREKFDFQKSQAAKPDDAGVDFGRGMSGQAYEILTNNHLKRQQGIQLTPQEEAAEIAARRIIETPRISIDPQTGAQTTITPVAPFGQGQPAPSGQPQAAAGEQPTGGPNVRVERAGNTKMQAQTQSVYNTIGNIADLLDQSGEEATGVSGFVDRNINPFMRQLGVGGEDTTAEELKGAYSMLTNQVGELITSGVMSDQDVRRLEGAVGQIDLQSDPPILRKKLANIVRMLEGMSGAYGQ